MSSNPVVFIAFEMRENLGIRYLSSVLLREGFRVHILDFQKERRVLLDELKSIEPLLVGFSVICEHHIDEFISLIHYLRKHRVNCHFTAGGHYASLRPDELFQLAPDLDSIVRFEGELTILDLAVHLHHESNWKDTTGISYLENGKVFHNELRPLESNLDSFPFPDRTEAQEKILDRNMTTLIASRGCIHRCIFCDSREFFRQSKGPLKRVRDPVKVVEEMEYLFHEKECSIFSFQDDDFPVRVGSNKGWIEQFCNSIREKKLKGNIIWKINCRPDEITVDQFRMMKEHGLFRVFMGIEEGTDSGLNMMRKQFGISDILKAIQILKELEISIDYGYMLFHPETTFVSLGENLNFLEQICLDGNLPVLFLKMMPYLETEVARNLRYESRLVGRTGFLDYDFHEPALNAYYQFISESFSPWLDSPEGFLNMAKCASIFVSVFLVFNGKVKHFEKISNETRTEIALGNKFVLKMLRELADGFESGELTLKNRVALKNYADTIRNAHDSSAYNLRKIIDKISILNLAKSMFMH